MSTKNERPEGTYIWMSIFYFIDIEDKWDINEFSIKKMVYQLRIICHRTMEKIVKIKHFLSKKKSGYLPHYSSDNGLKGTVVK